VLFEDAVEALLVVFSEEDVVRTELGELAVERPVEGDARARCFAAFERLAVGGAGEQVVVGVG
jgi:hypothetical protein